MGELHWSEGSRTMDAVIRLEGVFDGSSAWELRHALRERGAAAQPVVIDFSAVRECHDFGVAVLAHGLTCDAPGLVELRGLQQRQAALVRFFGLDAGPAHDSD
jgi:hypothetical protein